MTIGDAADRYVPKSRTGFSSRAIATHLKRGGLIAYPTEYCFGLGCDPDNRRAVVRLLRIKRRPQRKGLILIAAHFHQIARYLQPRTQSEQAQLKNSGDRAVTYLLPTHHSAPRWLRGSHDTLGVRLTAYRPAAQLCRSLNSALVSTSANRSGKQPARSYAQCLRYFGSTVMVLPGRVGKGRKPSTISAWADGKIVRK